MQLTGVDTYRYCDPMFEAARITLAHMGESYTPEYIQGVSGSAFRIAGFCPSAPTICVAMRTDELLRLLGYDVEAFPLSGDGLDPDARGDELVELVKAELSAGRPAIVWHAFTNAEWDVVAGYEEEGNSFLGRGSYAGFGDYAKASALRPKEAVSICPAFGGLFVRDKVRQPDLGAAEVAAAAEAVAFARRKQMGSAAFEGIACYDEWIRLFSDPTKVRDTGDAYNYGVYRSVRQAAPAFLRSICPAHPGATSSLERAAAGFAEEATALASAEALLWWPSQAGPDAARNAEVVRILSAARGHYVCGVEALEDALPLMA